MKPSILLVIACFSSLLLAAQKDFEGVITYRVVPPPEKNKTSEIIDLKVSFTPGRILIKGSENSIMKSFVLINFDSGCIYTLHLKEKIYEKKLLQVINYDLGGSNIVEGYSTTPEKFNNIMLMMGGIIGVMNYADSLFYHVPEKYDLNPELMTVRNNRILLKGKIIMTKRWFSDVDEDDIPQKAPPEITIIATSIRPGPVNPQDFVIPTDYINDKLVYSDSATVAPQDSTSMMTIDSTISPKPSKPKQTPQKPQPSKPRPKSQTPAKGNLRKEP